MPTEHTLPTATRQAATTTSPTPARPQEQRAIQQTPALMTNTFLRIFAAIWIVVGCLASMVWVISLFVFLGGNVRPDDGSGEVFVYSAITVMVSWTAGLAMSWMANISDDLRAKAGR